MNELIVSPKYVENTVSSSRTFEEAMNIEMGNSVYGVVASLIDDNIEPIDSTIEFLGQHLAAKAVSSLYDKQYYNPKYGHFKNFLTRNIIIDKSKSEQMETDRQILAAGTMFATEAIGKWGVRGLQYLANEEERFRVLSQVYSILYCFTYSDGNNIRNADTELSKIRNAFPLSRGKIVKIKNKTEKNNILRLGDLDVPLLSQVDNQTLENISYLLYSIFYQKYDNPSECTDKLLAYYNLLGYHEGVAKELIRENENTYNTIINDQKKYLAIAKKLVIDLSPNLPEFDLTRISQQKDEMAKYEPKYYVPKKVSNLTKSGILTLAGVFSKNPQLVINGGAQALSQFNLDDNGKEVISSALKKSGIEESAISQIFKQAKSLKETAKQIFNAENESK